MAGLTLPPGANLDADIDADVDAKLNADSNAGSNANPATDRLLISSVTVGIFHCQFCLVVPHIHQLSTVSIVHACPSMLCEGWDFQH